MEVTVTWWLITRDTDCYQQGIADVVPLYDVYLSRGDDYVAK
jgi:hypothetical protein